MAPIVLESNSMAEVLRRLGLKVTGGSYAWIPKVIASHGIDYSHFKGKRNNSGVQHKGGPDKLLWSEILVFDRLDGKREALPRLRRALLESGVAETWWSCGLLPFWAGKRLVLQIEHRNGNFVDNRPENVCFMCPNCHSQTDTFAGKRNKKIKVE